MSNSPRHKKRRTKRAKQKSGEGINTFKAELRSKERTQTIGGYKHRTQAVVGREIDKRIDESIASKILS